MSITTDERLGRVRAKSERARVHLDELESVVSSFLASEPYVIAASRRPETREVVYEVASARTVPPIIPAIAADVLRNLRTSLDHMACELVRAVGNYPTRITGFPIFANFGIYQAQIAEKTHGMPETAVDAIDSIKPYGKGGPLWRLQYLCNVEKQRPVMIEGMAYRFDNVTPGVLAYLQTVWSNRPGGLQSSSEAATQEQIRHDRRARLQLGDILFVDLPDAEMGAHREISFDLMFGQGEIGYFLPVVETLREMADHVDGILTELTPMLA